jgi:putative proteasome-type protease
MKMIRSTWGARLRQVFGEIPDPAWRDAPAASSALRLETQETAPVRAPLPSGLAAESGEAEPAGAASAVQVLAQQHPTQQNGGR